MKLGDKTVLGVDCQAPTFRHGLKRIKDQQLGRDIREAIRSLLLLDLDQAPAKLHLHHLTGKKVPSRVNPSVKVAAWTIHVTANDVYKASFTFEDGVVYLRTVDEHDIVDSDP